MVKSKCVNIFQLGYQARNKIDFHPLQVELIIKCDNEIMYYCYDKSFGFFLLLRFFIVITEKIVIK